MKSIVVSGSLIRTQPIAHGRFIGEGYCIMFEFDDELFPFETFSFLGSDDGRVKFDTFDMDRFEYLGDDIWVVEKEITPVLNQDNVRASE